MARRGNPAFAGGVVAVAVAAVAYALTVASVRGHTYVHVMAGVLWTGIDLFLGGVQGLFQLLLVLVMVYLRYGGV